MTKLSPSLGGRFCPFEMSNIRKTCFLDYFWGGGNKVRVSTPEFLNGLARNLIGNGASKDCVALSLKSSVQVFMVHNQFTPSAIFYIPIGLTCCSPNCWEVWWIFWTEGDHEPCRLEPANFGSLTKNPSFGRRFLQIPKIIQC